MKAKNVLVMLIIVFLVFKVPSWLRDKAEVASLRDGFNTKINEMLEHKACVKEGPFPFSSRVDPARLDMATGTRRCEKCDLLFQAGLLDKEVVEFALTGREESGKKGFETIYTLTDLGRSVYVPGSGDNSYYSKNPPRFCFGKVRLHKITRTFGPVTFGEQKDIGIRYVAVLENPHPFLRDERARLLGISWPTGDPPLYPEANVTAVYIGNKDFFWMAVSR